MRSRTQPTEDVLPARQAELRAAEQLFGCGVDPFVFVALRHDAALVPLLED